MGFTLPKGKEREYRARAGELLPAVLLPAPPSTNNLFNSVIIPRPKGERGGGKYPHLKVIRPPTDEYEAWQAAAEGKACLLVSPTSYPCVLKYTLVGRWHLARDGDNLKAVADALVRAAVLADDNLRHVVGGSWRYEGGPGEPMVKVEIEETAPSLFGA